MTLDRLAAALADRYAIERELGAGGMATVYLAEDLKHKRKVALKVLRPELAAVLGADRFVQEITTTASLQHPHILPLFDSGEAGGFLYYVMPYVQGETLRDKLDRETQLGIEEALRIATEVADALDYAHRNGVIHRDIKPENILLHDGRPMVADFGIALAVSAAASGRMTETGLSLGTPHYMSPEQATAEKEITGRSDVYSLACVLYEMLTGNPPHVGASAQQIVMKIVAEEAAPVTQLRKSVPPNVAAALGKALEKVPADRFATAKDFAEALANPGYRTTTAGAAGAPAALPSSRLAALLAAIAILTAGLAGWGWLRPRPELPVIRYGLALPAGQGVLPNSSIPQVAPDGSFLVYFGPVPGTSAAQQLWLKRRDSYAARPIPGTVGAVNVAISPDSRSIAFTVLNQLKTLLLTGGTPVTLTDSAAAGFTLAWLDDGTIVYSTVGATAELRRIPASGGTSILISRSDSRASRYPVALPGSRSLLFSRCSPGADCTEWAYDGRRDTAYALAAMSPTHLVSARLQYAESGYLLFLRDGALVAAPFDPDRLAITGSAVVLADSVKDFSLSRSGTLVLWTGEPDAAGSDYQLVWVDRDGRETPVDTSFTFHLTSYTSNQGWALSPDGTRLALGLHSREGEDLWLKPLPSGAASRITYAPTAEYRPRWTPDGRSVIFGSDRVPYGIYQRRADGTGSDSLLVKSDFVVQEAVVTGDGAWLLARLGGSAGPGGRDILGLRIGKDTALKPILATRFDEDAIAPSPDGHWLAYQSDETGEIEVFIRSFPNVDQVKRQVSSGGGVAPLWSRDGRELFYLSAGNDMMSVRVTAGATLTLGNPVKLFHVPDDLLQVETAYYTPWDVAPDGRFIMVRAMGAPEESSGTIVVVENFLKELKTRMHQ